jgi:Transposase DDE domain
MRAEGIVRQVLRDVEGKIHQARLSAVTAAAVALIRGGKIGLAALGRAIGPKSYKHGIKRIDRLFGNEALAAELEVFYAALARYVVRSMERPVILLDWTEAGPAKWALTAAVPLEGRAITIHSVVVPVSKYTSVKVERDFLATLRGFLGEDCRPILVGDAGFRAPWMKHVRAMGWDFVVRVRGRTLVQRVGESTWRYWKQLGDQARRTPRTLGTYLVTRQQRVEAQLVALDQRTRKRRAHTRPRGAPAMRARRAYREPWLLATSLDLPAKQIVKLYRARMQIELTFRDLKSHRFGWSFEDARCRSTRRIAIQIMLVAIASLVTLLVGLAAEHDGLSRHFQANTIRNRRVISLVALGRAVLATFREQRIVEVHDHLPFKGIL